MRRAFWMFWAVVFGLVFLLPLGTKFTEMFTRHGLPFAWLILTAVGCVACRNAARLRPARGRRSA